MKQTWRTNKKLNILIKKKIKDTHTTYKEIIKKEFDCIIISPGIDINKCKLSKFLKKNHKTNLSSNSRGVLRGNMKIHIIDV